MRVPCESEKSQLNREEDGLSTQPPPAPQTTNGETETGFGGSLPRNVSLNELWNNAALY